VVLCQIDRRIRAVRLPRLHQQQQSQSHTAQQVNNAPNHTWRIDAPI
jgi:hypothetical protein